MKSLFAAAAAAAALVLAVPGAANAWGHSAHRMIGEVAMQALPPEAPAFLRTPQAALDVGEFSREPDNLKGAGKLLDNDRSPAHFVDLDDDGKILGGPSLADLPPTREAFDTALRAVGQDSWKAGYLPYAMIDRWQSLARSFGYWRALDAALRNPAWSAHHAWFAAAKRRREAQVLATIGELSHFVGDGSQPMHVTVHFNGWGQYPNPQGYTQAKFHEAFEGDMVRNGMTRAQLVAALAPPKVCDCPIEQRTAAFLVESGRRLGAIYDLEKVGGLAPGDPRGPALAAVLMGRGAGELRDQVLEAWRASPSQMVGWRPIRVSDVMAGKIDPYNALYGID